MLRRWLLLVLSFFVLAGCVTNGSYKAESLQHIKNKHADMVESYKYGTGNDKHFDEEIEESVQGEVV